MKGCGSVSYGEFLRALLEEFNKLSPEEQDRLLARRDQYAKGVKAARAAGRDLKPAEAKP